jgi:hypothetical protein
MNKSLPLITCLLFLLLPHLVLAKSAKSRYVILQYSNKELLHDFNDQIRLGRKLSHIAKRRNIITVEDEVLAKIDTIIEKAEVILDMFPNNMKITVVLLPGSRDVSRVFKQKYGKNVNHIAYYSLSEDTIYISVNDAKLRVLAHEVGHAVVDHYFKVRPPYNIHELMAQFTEKHITD